MHYDLLRMIENGEPIPARYRPLVVAMLSKPRRRHRSSIK
jgi:hypothetical protein